VSRARALLEILICSGYPTQLLILGTMKAAGMVPRGGSGDLSLTFIAVLSLVDATLVVSLVWLFLRASDEHARELLLGVRPRLPEAAFGLLLIPVSFLVAVSVIVLLTVLAPWLHNVVRNPFEAMLRTTTQQVVLAFVVMIAGGLREEIQRAFILHRFEQSLGGAAVGLVIWSLAFGAGHLEQGRDVAIATAALGAFWGLVYLRRRSVVAPAVAHAGFNLSEILRHAIR
jgi:membrane protease YdiL (CAAX protease family)